MTFSVTVFFVLMVFSFAKLASISAYLLPPVPALHQERKTPANSALFRPGLSLDQ
jgi:hypothetical protein